MTKNNLGYLGTNVYSEQFNFEVAGSRRLRGIAKYVLIAVAAVAVVQFNNRLLSRSVAARVAQGGILVQ